MATVSKKFVDLNPNFEKNPLTKDLPLLKNAEAIKFAVKNIDKLIIIIINLLIIVTWCIYVWVWVWVWDVEVEVEVPTSYM